MRRPAALVVLVAVCAVLVLLHERGQAAAPVVDVGVVPAVAPGSAVFRAQVVRVVDGDTFVARLDGRGPPLRVRVIGVDTPETVKPGVAVRCFGPQASAFTKHLLPPGAWVRAAYEAGGTTDRYGRQLWDVWLADGRFLEAVLVGSGAARAYPYAPQLEHAAVLADLQRQAESARRGLWGQPCNGHSF
jgi:micrococcal nuclease